MSSESEYEQDSEYVSDTESDTESKSNPDFLDELDSDTEQLSQELRKLSTASLNNQDESSSSSHTTHVSGLNHIQNAKSCNYVTKFIDMKTDREVHICRSSNH